MRARGECGGGGPDRDQEHVPWSLLLLFRCERSLSLGLPRHLCFGEVCSPQPRAAFVKHFTEHAVSLGLDGEPVGVTSLGFCSQTLGV